VDLRNRKNEKKVGNIFLNGSFLEFCKNWRQWENGLE
jgi:hypothetical protein